MSTTISVLNYVRLKVILQEIRIGQLGLNNVIYDLNAKLVVDGFNNLSNLSPFNFIIRDYVFFF